MSAGDQDVLDNWEEIDEIGLNSKLDKLKKEAAKMNAQTPPRQQPLQNSDKPIKMIMMGDDDYRTQYGPSEPTVKILRRPTHERNDKSSTDSKPKVPVKTLQQREHEYAQARLRILGAARSPEEQTGQSDTSLVLNNCLTTNITAASSAPTLLPQEDGVIRLPKGPDGSTGFSFRR